MKKTAVSEVYILEKVIFLIYFLSCLYFLATIGTLWSSIQKHQIIMEYDR